DADSALLARWFFSLVRSRLPALSCFFFFFSSRRRHTRLVSDWSSDVCSSDLASGGRGPAWWPSGASRHSTSSITGKGTNRSQGRSEERRVGKEGRSRWAPYH